MPRESKMKEALVKSKDEMKFLKNVKVKTDYSGDVEALITALLTNWSSTVRDIADDVCYSKDISLSQLSKLEDISFEMSRVHDRITGEVE